MLAERLLRRDCAPYLAGVPCQQSGLLLLPATAAGLRVSASRLPASTARTDGKPGFPLQKAQTRSGGSRMQNNESGGEKLSS